MKISLGTWAFTFGPYADRPVALADIIERCAEAGCDGLEVSGFPPHLTRDQYPTPASRAGLKRMLDDHNLGVSGYLADMTTVNPMVEGNQQRYLDLFNSQLELCHSIESPMVRVDTVAAPGSMSDDEYAEAVERLAELWHRAADLATQAGARVAWEFEPGFAINKPSEVLALHKRVHHPNFYLLFDTSHAYMCSVVGARQQGETETLKGGVNEFLAMVHDRVGAIHVIDSDGTLYVDETSTHRPFGEGLIDFESLAPDLLSIERVEWWCIDLSFCSGVPELIGPSLAFVRELAGAKAGT